MPTDKMGQINPGSEGSWDLLSGKSLKKLLATIEAQKPLAGTNITTVETPDGVIINYNRSTCPVVGIQCKSISSGDSKAGWILTNEDCSPRTPKVFYKERTVAISWRYHSPNPSTDDDQGALEGEFGWHERIRTIIDPDYDPELDNVGSGTTICDPFDDGCYGDIYYGYYDKIYLSNPNNIPSDQYGIAFYRIWAYDFENPDPFVYTDCISYFDVYEDRFLKWDRRPQPEDVYTPSNSFYPCCCDCLVCGGETTLTMSGDSSVTEVCDHTFSYPDESIERNDHWERSIELSSEYTTGTMTGNALARMPSSYPDEWSGSCGAFRGLPPSEDSYEITRFKYRFYIQDTDGQPLTDVIIIRWTERFTPYIDNGYGGLEPDLGNPINTEHVWAGVANGYYTPEFQVNEPGTNGAINMVNVRWSQPGDCDPQLFDYSTCDPRTEDCTGQYNNCCQNV